MRSTPTPEIFDLNKNVTIFVWSSLYPQDALSTRRHAHRLDSVCDQIHHDLFELHSVTGYVFEIRSQLKFDGYSMTAQFEVQ